MHIMYIHMAMAVMRIAFNIVSAFYRIEPSSVKSAMKNQRLSPLPLQFSASLPMISSETF